MAFEKYLIAKSFEQLTAQNTKGSFHFIYLFIVMPTDIEYSQECPRGNS